MFRHFPKLLYTLLLLLIPCLAVFSLLPLQRASETHTDWMAELDDSVSLNTLSIPGTHDSGALYSLADVFGKCQTLSVREQLQAGVRFFDIRLQLVGNDLRVVHSIADQMTDFEDILTDMILFLREHPNEFLLVSFKEDASPRRSNVSFAEALEKILLAYEEVSREDILPASVGDARGKMHVLARYKNATIGLPCYDGWRDDTSFTLGGLYVQDNYCVGNSGEKFLDITNTLTSASARESALTLNYTSCYLAPSFPPVYAGIPAHDIRFWLKESISLHDEALGVLICDFMTSELAKMILRRNFT